MTDHELQQAIKAAGRIKELRAVSEFFDSITLGRANKVDPLSQNDPSKWGAIKYIVNEGGRAYIPSEEVARSIHELIQADLQKRLVEAEAAFSEL